VLGGALEGLGEELLGLVEVAVDGGDGGLGRQDLGVLGIDARCQRQLLARSLEIAVLEPGKRLFAQGGEAIRTRHAAHHTREQTGRPVR
jgi:hypothetical protein